MIDSIQYVQQVKDAAIFIKGKTLGFNPVFALTLGSGMGKFAEKIEVKYKIQYKGIPHFPQTTVDGHKGELIFGTIEGVPIVALSGRTHYYEVADSAQGVYKVAFPVHVMASLGIKNYFSTNAAGGLNLKFKPGDLMVVDDHIDLFMLCPITGAHFDFGDNPYYQSQISVYDQDLSILFEKASIVYEGGNVFWGILTARVGRTFETAADSRALRILGADAVGMSTIIEAQAAINRGMKVLAVSLITNVMEKNGKNNTSHKEVLEVSEDPVVAERISKIISKFFELYKLEQEALISAT